MIWGLTTLIFLSVLILGLGSVYLVFGGLDRRAQAVKRRLDGLAPGQQVSVLDAHALMRKGHHSSIGLLNSLLSRLPQISDLELMLHRAGNPCNLGILVLTAGTLSAFGLLVGALQHSLLLAFGLGALGPVLPWYWLKFLQKRRLGAFDEQFPEAVELMARALRAGHSFGSALSMAASETEDPVSEELTRTFEDYNFGKSLEHALADLARRVGLQDVKFFATAVSLQRETGGNLAEILDNIGHIIRERFRLVRQVKALSAEGRLSGVILSLMAPGLLGLLWFISPQYIDLLFSHPLGMTMLVTGGLFELMGILVIRKLVKLKV